MATYFPPKKNTAYIIYVALESVATAGAFQANPTLASGDFKVSIDGGTLNNLTTLPTVTPASGKMVKISLSSSEMNGDNITVVCSDASGAEWKDLVLNFQTVANQIDDLATATALNTVDDFLDTEIAAIKAKTDNLPADTAAVLTIIDDFLDTEVAAIKAKTDNLPAAPAATGDIPSVAAIADAVLKRGNSNVDGSAEENSIYELIQAILQGDTSTGAWVIYRTNGSTVFNTRTLATDANADPIVGVS